MNTGLYKNNKPIIDLKTGKECSMKKINMSTFRRLSTQSFDISSPIRVNKIPLFGDSTTR